MKTILKKSPLDKVGTLLLALAIWYVVRQRTELRQSQRPPLLQPPPSAR
jgi:hypothetical protein